MASVFEFRKGYRAFVRVKGFAPLYKTFATRQEAETWAAKEEAKLKPNSTAYDLDTPTLREIWELHEEKNKIINSTTFQRERRTVVPILKLLGDFAVKNISTGTVQRYFDKRVRTPNQKGSMPAPDTLRLEKALLSKLFKIAQVRDYCNNNPVRGISFELPKCKHRETRILLDGQKKLLDKAAELVNKTGQGKQMNKTILPYLKFLFATGMRPGEAAKIKLEWIFWNPEKGKISIPTDETKKRKARVVSIPQSVYLPLLIQFDEARTAGSEYLFYSKATKTGEFVPYRYSKAFSRIAEKCKVDAVPHSIRHELVSRLFEETTLSDSVIASIVGHNSTASLTPYKHLRSEALRQHVEDFNDSQLEKIAQLNE